jgi:OmpA family
MVYRPFRTIGRFVLAACIVSLGTQSLISQTAPAAPASGEVNPSRFDLFTGYSYFGAHGQVQPAAIRYSSIDLGAIGSGAYYFDKYFGGEAIFVAHPDGKNDGLYTISAGPIFRAPMQNFTVFAHGLVGAAKLGGPNAEGSFPYHNPYKWGPALTAGGGMDYDVPFFDNRFSIRLFEADYRWMHVNYGQPALMAPTVGALGGRTNLNGIDLSAGIVTHFGHIIPPPPVTYSCSASPTSVFPGDPITVTGTALNLNPKKTPTYTWTADGGTITGTGPTATIATTNANPGSYTAKGHVSEGEKPGMMADCSATYTVKAFEPPTVSCSANPSTVNPGDSSTITATGMSPQNRPLTYSYSASAGTVTGNTSTATLSTAGAAPGTITVTANVVDDKGQSASCTTQVSVTAPPPPPAPTTSSLCSMNFERDKRRPGRVDNEAKACLDDVALSLQQRSDAKIILVGSSTAAEKAAAAKSKKKPAPADLAAQRAVNAKDYLVTEKGIDASRVSVYTNGTDAQTVTTTLVPAGATADTSGDTSVDESAVKAVPRTPPARTKK